MQSQKIWNGNKIYENKEKRKKNNIKKNLTKECKKYIYRSYLKNNEGNERIHNWQELKTCET